MKNNFSKDFRSISTKEWKQKIQYELQGADYEKTMVWQDADDIKIKPFYNDEDVKVKFKYPNTNTKIGQEIYVFDIAKSLKTALKLIEKGFESLVFIIPNQTTDIHTLLNQLPDIVIDIHFKFEFLSFEYIQNIEKITYIKKWKLHYNIDPIGNLAKDGNWHKENQDNFEFINQISQLTELNTVLMVDTCLYQNAGASHVQEIAYAMSTLIEYLNRIKINKQAVVFKIALGNNLCFEIAKIRAYSILFDLIAKTFNINQECKIICEPSNRNQTLINPSINIWNNNVACMAGFMAGANAVFNSAHDALYRKLNYSSNILAQNQLIELKENYKTNTNEMIFDGFYLNSITLQLTEKALDLTKDIERKGGFLQLLIDGTIKSKINQTGQKEQEIFDKKLLQNKLFRTKIDLNDIELYPFVKIKPRKTIVVPIIAKRLSENHEKECFHKFKTK
jgi:methylmalonyl-CoA mutase